MDDEKRDMCRLTLQQCLRQREIRNEVCKKEEELKEMGRAFREWKKEQQELISKLDNDIESDIVQLELELK